MICKCYRIKAGMRRQNHLRSILAEKQMAQRDGRHHPLLGHLFITIPPITDPATKRSWDLKLTRNHRCCKCFLKQRRGSCNRWRRRSDEGMSRWISLDARPGWEPPTDGKVSGGRWREMGQDVTERGRTKHLSFGGR